MTEQELLLAYGEWLADQSLFAEGSGDNRSLDQLAIDFLAERTRERLEVTDEKLRG